MPRYRAYSALKLHRVGPLTFTHRRVPLGTFERLEERTLLNIGGGWEYDAVHPAWFADIAAEAGANEEPLAASTAAEGANSEGHSPSRWIVRLNEQAVEQVGSVAGAGALLATGGGQFEVIRGLGLPGQMLVQAEGTSRDAAETALQQNAYLAYFAPDVVIQAQLTPDDPQFGELWNLESNDTPGDDGPDIDAPGAWDRTTGDPAVVVAVLDTGIDYTHPDLAANMWHNPGEIPGNGIDDDQNGFEDDIYGYDFVNNDSDPMDDHRHGTHVAGTIAAVGDNATGTTGVAWSTSLMALKWLDEQKSGLLSDAIRAINYATEMRTLYGVNLVATNNSWGYRGQLREDLKDALQRQCDAGILFVAAAGNGDALGWGIDNDADDRYAFYPASAAMDNIISVAAVDVDGRLARFSNYGAATVDLAAPGVGILSTEPGGAYGSRSGTSMAAPHVTGTAALIWADLLASGMTDATYAEVRDAILETVDVQPQLQGKLATDGWLNAHAAVEIDTFAPRATLVGPSDVTGPGGTFHEFSVVYTDNRGVDDTSLDGSEIAVIPWYSDDPMPGLTLESVQVEQSGRRVTATYRVPAPDGTWGPDDDGDYEVVVQADSVYDGQYNYTPSGVLGSFNVDTTEGLIRVYNYEDGAAGPDTLRWAIIEANSQPGENTVRLRPGNYTLTIPGPGEDAAATGDLDVTENLILRGAGADVTTIDAAGLDRVLHVHPGVTLTVRDVSVTGGTADSGGGILVEPGAALTVARAGIYDNQATGSGGGIGNLGTLTVEQSALYDNAAVAGGGGLDNQGTAEVVNTTASGNVADGAGSTGGGILNPPGSTLTLVNCTVADNQAETSGGGIHNTGTADLLNTLIAGNTAPAGPDAFGTFVSQGYNLLGTSADSSGWQVTDLLDVDPLIGPLQSNGGTAPTHALLQGSPAIDAGDDASAPATDQRGIARPQDADGDEVSTADIGAVEKYFGEIHGVRYHDLDGDGARDTGEPGLAGLGMYLDLNGNGLPDRDEPTSVTLADDPSTPGVDETGVYSFLNLGPGPYSVNEVLDAGWMQSWREYGRAVERLSVGKERFSANARSSDPSISGDGRFVAFESRATNLVAGDTNGYTDMFVHDREADTIERISVTNEGAEGNGDSYHASVSADGRYVAFDSWSTNLVPDDTNSRLDVFVFDRQLCVIERVSIADDGTQGNGSSDSPSISADGRYVAFYSSATNLVLGDTNNESDIFVYDRQQDTIERVSIAHDGAQADGYCGSPAISADGRFVAFHSFATNLVPGGSSGVRHVFVYDRQTHSVDRVSQANDGSEADGSSAAPSISADGRYVAFESDAINLVSGDTNGDRDVFVYDRDLDSIQRISVAEDGTQGNGFSYHPSISADGQHVGFYSYASTLVPNDTTDRDVFMHHRQTGTIELVGFSDDGSHGGVFAEDLSLTADGESVAFESYLPILAPGDTNSDIDVYVYSGRTGLFDLSSRVWLPAESNNESSNASISWDGRYVVFASDADNLVPDDTNAQRDVFVCDRMTRAIERVSVAGDGTEANGMSSRLEAPTISADGRYVSFSSYASNLVAGDTNNAWDIFVYDRDLDNIERVSVGSNAAQGNSHSEIQSISANGRYVAFKSNASNLVSDDTNNATDVFVYDRQEGVTERVNVASDGSQANPGSGMYMDPPSISADGRYVAFTSNATSLVSGDTDGYDDVYVFDRHARTIEWASVAESGAGANHYCFYPSISADGRYVAFESYATNLVPGDTNGTSDIFVFDRETDSMDRVSVAGDGSEGNAASYSSSISANGLYVAFYSHATNLVLGDSNASSDVFVHDRDTGSVERLSVSDAGTEGNNDSYRVSLSGDGRYVAFESNASNIVPMPDLGIKNIFVNAAPGIELPYTYDVQVTAGSVVEALDFGDRPVEGNIRGQVFDDRDGDGSRDVGEPALEGWTLYLDADGSGDLDGFDPSTASNVFGEYAFEDLPALETYTVAVVPEEFWVQTTPRPIDGGAWTIELGAGELRDDVDFGFDYRGPGGQDLDEITGIYFRDDNGNARQDPAEPGVGGATIDLAGITSSGLPYSDSVTTGSDGSYRFQGVPVGEYTVESQTPPGWEQTTPLDNAMTANTEPLGTFDRTQGLAVGPFDDDLWPDLAVANGNYISVLYNDGSGGLGAPQSFPAGTGALALVAGHFNPDQDQYLDLAVTNYYTNTVSVLFGQGGRNLGQPVSYEVGYWPHGLAAGDFDGDGYLDLAVGTEAYTGQNGKLWVLWNDGTGSFTPETVYSSPTLNPFAIL